MEDYEFETPEEETRRVNKTIEELLWFLSDEEDRIRSELFSETAFGDYEVVYAEEAENPKNIVPTTRARTIMTKLRKIEAVRLPRVLKRGGLRPWSTKCAQASVLNKRDVRVFIPGPWLKCPFHHDVGDEYTGSPLSPKKVFCLRKAFSLRAIRRKQFEKKLQGCKFCSGTVFTHHKDIDLHYEDYLEQVTRVNHPKQDCMAQVDDRYFYSGRIPKNSLLEYDMSFMPINEPVRPLTAGSELSPRAAEELKYMLDPRCCNSPFVDLSSDVTGVSKRVRYKRISPKKPVPTFNTPGSRRIINFPAAKSYADVKSRYMLPVKRLIQLKAPESEEEEKPRNPFPMPDDAIYEDLPPTPSFMRKIKPVYQQLKPKEAKLEIKPKIDHLKDSRTESKPSIRLAPKPQLSARMEFLSQPKPRKTRASLNQRSLRFRTADNSRTVPKPKPTTPNLLVKRNNASLTQGAKKKKLAVKKLNGKRKLQRKVKHVLSAFGFDFDIPPKLSETRMNRGGGTKAKTEKKNPPTETQREKYRMSVLKMLEKASIRSKKKKEMERIEQLERGIAAMAIQAGASARAAEKYVPSVIFM